MVIRDGRIDTIVKLLIGVCHCLDFLTQVVCENVRFNRVGYRLMSSRKIILEMVYTFKYSGRVKCVIMLSNPNDPRVHTILGTTCRCGANDSSRIRGMTLPKFISSIGCGRAHAWLYACGCVCSEYFPLLTTDQSFDGKVYL